LCTAEEGKVVARIGQGVDGITVVLVVERVLGGTVVTLDLIEDQGIAPGLADGVDIAVDGVDAAGLAGAYREGVAVATKHSRGRGVGVDVEAEVVAATGRRGGLVGEQVEGLAGGQGGLEQFAAIALGRAGLVGAEVGAARGLGEVEVEAGGKSLVLHGEAGAVELAGDERAG